MAGRPTTGSGWQRKNSQELKQRTRALPEELKSRMKAGEVEKLEHSVSTAMQRTRIFTKKLPAEFIGQGNTANNKE